MTALALSHIELKGLYHGPEMQQTASSDDIFAPPQLKRCQSTTEYPVKHAPYYGDTRKKTRCSDGDLPEEIISLSYDLLNQIQRHEQFENRADSGISDVSSRDDHSGSTVLSMSADSSTFQYNGYHPDVLSDLADDAASLSPLSSIDSPSYTEFSPCDSVAANTKKASKAIKSGNVGPTKPLYTAELQVLCRICGDRASGFHYGVHSCEGCKGFFRRTLKKDLVYKPCRENAQCRIDTGTRNKCQYCRYQKCLNAGMSQNAVRFGRMPKAEREKLIADKEELSNTCSSRIMELRTLSDTIKGAFQDCFVQCKFVTNYLQGNAKQIHIKVEPDLRFATDSLSGPMFVEQNIFQAFQEAIIPIIEGTVKFTKKIPKFSDLAMSDRITLLKQNCFCVPLILTYLMFDNATLHLEGKSSSVSVTDCGGHYQCWEAQCLFEGIFQISRKLVDMQLKLVEVALYCAIVLLVESPGIMSYSEVENLQQELLNSLRLELKHNHPKEKYLFARLLVLIPLLVQVTEEFRSNLKGQLFDNSTDFSRTHELVCEIFDLR